jgi:hypothetical protein
VVGNKRGYNTDVIEVYEKYYSKLTEKLFSTKLDCMAKMDQIIDADLRYSIFPGLILYMVSHGLSMMEQRYFGRRLQSSQVRVDVPRREDKSPKSSKRYKSSSRSSSSSRGSSSSRSRSLSRNSSRVSQRDSKSSREKSSPRGRAYERSQHPVTADQSTKISASPNTRQSTGNQTHTHPIAEERINRFDRVLLSEEYDKNSPLQSRSNSLVITDITYTDDQTGVHVELDPIVVQPNNTNNQVGKKRLRGSSKSDEESNRKRSKTENYGKQIGDGSVTLEKQDGYSSAITNSEPTVDQELTTHDELLELLASWQ